MALGTWQALVPPLMVYLTSFSKTSGLILRNKFRIGSELSDAKVKEHLQFLTVDEYMKNDLGELVLKRARELIQKGVQHYEDVMDFRARIRKERTAEKLEAFREKQRQKYAPELRLVLKGLWTNVAMDYGLKRQAKGWESFRQDPVKRRRRLTRGLEFEDLDKYDENGEPIWARIDAARG